MGLRAIGLGSEKFGGQVRENNTREFSTLEAKHTTNHWDKGEHGAGLTSKQIRETYRLTVYIQQ